MYTNNDENTNEVSGAEANVWRAINPTIVGAIGLTENERTVLGALMVFQMGRDVSKVAKRSGIPRTTTLYTLKKL